MTHMLGMYPNCKWMKDNFHDIFSSLEQEICSLSDTFLYASGSSWSLNIVMERHSRNIRKFLLSSLFNDKSQQMKRAWKTSTSYSTFYKSFIQTSSKKHKKPTATHSRCYPLPSTKYHLLFSAKNYKSILSFSVSFFTPKAVL